MTDDLSPAVLKWEKATTPTTTTFPPKTTGARSLTEKQE
jgi:hypothetical protein